MTEVFQIVPAASKAMWWIFGIAVIPLLIFFFFGYILHSSRHASFEVSDTGLRIRGDLYGRAVPASSIIASGITKIDLRYDREHQPKWRSNGIAVPGYLSGWFRLRNGEKALLFVTDRQQVVYRNRYSLLVSVQEPDRFLSALQRLPQ